MSFKIKDNQIKLIESSVTEGEGGNPEEFAKGIHRIKILKSGKIQISIAKND